MANFTFEEDWCGTSGDVLNEPAIYVQFFCRRFFSFSSEKNGKTSPYVES